MTKEEFEYVQSTPSLFRIIVKLFLILFLFSLIVIGAYFLYQNIPGEPESFNAYVQPVELETENLTYEVRQFYPNMKFNHNRISYKIDLGCDDEKKQRMVGAFNELQKKVGIISFYSTGTETPDIEVTCSANTKPLENKDYFVGGEGGAKEIIKTGRYNVITEGVILLHENPHNFKKCEWPNVELHELLHVFGFDHSDDENSLMYPYLESCDQRLDDSIVSDLKKLYSEENLVDLYFQQAEATKKGRYLDFNVTVKNSGVVNAKNVFLSVFDDGERIKDFELNDILLGAGINFYVANLGLKSRNSDNIKMMIDPDNLIPEIDEENNDIILEFSE